MPPKPLPVSLSREAHADSDAAVDWYIGEGAFIAADDFLDEVERAMNLLSRFPELGETGLHKTRMLPLHGFPYSLIYHLRNDAVRIIAIAHHSGKLCTNPLLMPIVCQTVFWQLTPLQST